MNLPSKVSALGAVLVFGTAFALADTITVVSGTSTQFVSETGNNAPNGVTPYNGGFFPGPSQPGLGVSGPAVILNTPVTPTWAAALPGSWWVSYAQTGPADFVVNPPNGNYWFTQTFTTLSNESYAGVLNILADDTVVVFLNGVRLNTPSDPMGYPHCSAGTPNCINPVTGTPITLSNIISGGTNTLTFQLIQGGGSDLGIDFAATITGTTVPEPNTLLLLGTGLIGSAGALMRRMRA